MSARERARKREARRDRTSGARARIAALVVATALVACATLPPESAQPGRTVADAPFDVAGRISARRGTNGVAGGFTWAHTPSHDAIDLSTPLGQMLARLEGVPGNVSVQLSNGSVEHAATWSALTERALGVTIPVEGLAYWIRADAAPGSASTVERDDHGRVSVLRQDGWNIVYAYADDGAKAPHRVTLTYPGAEPVEVRVVVDRGP